MIIAVSGISTPISSGLLIFVKTNLVLQLYKPLVGLAPLTALASMVLFLVPRRIHHPSIWAFSCTKSTRSYPYTPRILWRRAKTHWSLLIHSCIWLIATLGFSSNDCIIFIVSCGHRDSEAHYSNHSHTEDSFQGSNRDVSKPPALLPVSYSPLGAIFEPFRT